jgi:hypothetical protein
MNAQDICRTLSGELGELYTCSTLGSFQRIRTPYLYPDGDNIDIFLVLWDFPWHSTLVKSVR